MGENINSVLDTLKTELLKHYGSPGTYLTAINGLHIHHMEKRNQSVQCLYNPFIGIVLQGKKKALIGGKEYQIYAGDCIAAGMDLPALTEIIEVQDDEPLLMAVVPFDRFHFTQFEADVPDVPVVPVVPIVPIVPVTKDDSGQCAAFFQAPEELIDAFLRLIRLLDRPERIPVLAPMIIREIHYLVFSDSRGNHLRSCATPGAHNAKVTEAIVWLRQNYRQGLRVKELARSVNMSSPNFHRRFREVTSFSPIQFQKIMRLSEARRLLLMEGKDSADAAQEVGYESVTQFNREYKRLFGEPPRRHVIKLLSSGVMAGVVPPG